VTDVQITGSETSVEVADDGVTVMVVSTDSTVAVTEVGMQGVPGPAHEIYTFTMQDQIETAVGTQFIPFDSDASLVSVQAVTSVSPTGQPILVDVNINNVSVWTAPGDRITIPAGQDESAVVTVFDTDTFVAGDRLSIDVDQVGSGNPGEDLVVLVRVLRN
jgi:hypothetical protein